MYTDETYTRRTVVHRLAPGPSARTPARCEHAQAWGSYVASRCDCTQKEMDVCDEAPEKLGSVAVCACITKTCKTSPSPASSPWPPGRSP
eukprot:3991657-Amphidinium_carterae.1